MLEFKPRTPEELQVFEEIERCQKIGRKFLIIKNYQRWVLLTGEETNKIEFIKTRFRNGKRVHNKKTIYKEETYEAVSSDDTVFSRIVYDA